MSGTTISVTAGNFTLTGIDAASFQTGVYNASFAPGNGQNFFYTSQNDFVFDFNDGTVNAGTGASQVVGVDASSTDSWSLTVTLDSSNSADALEVADGSTYLATGNDGIGSFQYFTVTGIGDSDLQSLIQSINLIGGGNSPFGVTFDLTDTSTTGQGSEAVFTTYYAACYATGTRIALPSGEARVEDLRIGDLVATASGIAKPVKWIGRRGYTAAQIAANPQLRPVIVRAGALAENMPHRDLMVSPIHGLFIDDVFVPAAALINGVSVLRSEALEPVSYVHIELDAHDVVFAEGAPAETFVDDDSRLIFDNADEYYDMFGADEMPRGFSAPRVEDGYQLEAIRRRLAVRAGLPAAAAACGALKGHVERLEGGVLEGWVMDEASHAAPVELDVLVDGEVVARVLANRYRTDLDHAGLAGGRCAFCVTLPASAVRLSQVVVRRAQDGAVLAMPMVAAEAV
jgi:hypothetical protein